MPVQKEGVWDVCVSSKTGDEYYFNPATKQSLWKKHEPPLPAGWGWGKEDGGRGGRFYVNLHTLARQSAAPESGAAPSGPSLKRPRSDEPEASSASLAAAAPAAPAAAHPTDSDRARARTFWRRAPWPRRAYAGRMCGRRLKCHDRDANDVIA